MELLFLLILFLVFILYFTTLNKHMTTKNEVIKKLWIIWGLVLIFYVITMVININDVIWGHNVTIINMLATIIYIFLWCLFIYFNINYKFTYLYWTLTCIVSIATIIVNITELDMPYFIVMVIFLLTPLYGVNYMGLSTIFCNITLILSISFIIFNTFIIKKSKY